MDFVITPIPNGEWFVGSIDDFFDSIGKYFLRFRQFIEKWKNAFILMNEKIRSERVDGIFSEDQIADFEKLFENKEFHDNVLLKGQYALLSSNLKEFFAEAHSLELNRYFERPEIDLTKFRTVQGESKKTKGQEVISFSYAFDLLLAHFYDMDQPIFSEAVHGPLMELLSKCPTIEHRAQISRNKIRLVDVGAGRGYLSIFLASEFNIRTLAIEASLAHSCHLRQRMDLLIGMKRVKPEQFEPMELSIGYVTPKTTIGGIVGNSLSYLNWLRTIAEYEKTTLKKPSEIRLLEHKLKKMGLTDHSLFESETANIEKIKYAEQSAKPRNIQGELAVEVGDCPLDPNNDYEFFCVSIHACGDLSVVSHEIAFNSERCRGAVSVPCCFQHLTPRCIPVHPSNGPIFEELFVDDLAVKKDYLNHALATYNISYDDHINVIKQFMPREVITAFVPPRTSVKKVKQEKGELFEDFVLRISKQFGDGKATIEDVRAQMDYCDRQKWRLEAQLLCREAVGHAFESFILLDRLCYYARLAKESKHHYVVGMFDVMSHVSPRGFSQFTLRLD